MRMKEVHFMKRQSGWVCEMTFSFTPRDHFCDETTAVRSAAYRWWIAAWWNCRISLKLFLAVNEATVAERRAKGWA